MPGNILCPYLFTIHFYVIYVQIGGIMERLKIRIRIKKNVYERIKLLASQENRSIQNLFDEVLEIGILEHLKEGNDV